MYVALMGPNNVETLRERFSKYKASGPIIHWTKVLILQIVNLNRPRMLCELNISMWLSQWTLNCIISMLFSLEIKYDCLE